MRASGGTNFGLDWSVVACTNSRIAFFAGPSFHEGSGSIWACTSATTSRHKHATRISRCLMGRFMCLLLFPPSSAGAGAPDGAPVLLPAQLLPPVLPHHRVDFLLHRIEVEGGWILHRRIPDGGLGELRHVLLH